MADALVSSLVHTILENMNALVLEELGVAGGLKAELENLESTLTTVQAVLHDAEQKQWKSEAVKNWLRKLKGAAYDADDVLDEFATEAQRRRQQQRDLKKRVRSFFSLERNPFIFRVKMAHRLKNVREKLDVIAEEKNKFHLREGVGDIEVDSFDWRLTSSLVNESEICGRTKEKEVLINLLLTNPDDLSVYAICGMAGLGKTTLAQLVYNDGSVRRHFDLRIWVCVSDDFDIRRLTRAIIESIECNPCNIQELDPLQRRLQEKLTGKKFLLVLDDVWDHYHDKWNGLKDTLRCGANGSAIIITTRIKTVGLKMSTVPLHSMRRLSEDDSWSLFKQRAFGIESREEHAPLESIGKAIVKKCGGIPLAIKAVGSVMRLKRKSSEWLSISECEIWDLPDEGSTILPALRLSYDHLPPLLKQCFAFCSIFPKDYIMEKDQLIELWMANGFISTKGHMDLHDMGNEIFSELVWRSLLQDVKEEIWGTVTCKMHDLFHDLAQSIMRNECRLIELKKELGVSREIRHLAIRKRLFQAAPWSKDLLKTKSLRSFIFLDGNRWSGKLLPAYLFEQKHLRALDISGCNVNKLRKSVGYLKHLRYLNVSNSSIEKLPESVSALQNLQTLNLKDCHYLSMLPKGMKAMKHLRYVDIESCDALRSMPVGMGQLTCLRKLTMFIVGKGDGRQIAELGGLNYLEGELSIMNLENVRNLADARNANLMSKKNLQSLSLYWGDSPSEESEDVLCGLQPHSSLKSLKISMYQGSKFPNWIMKLHLPNLVEIWLGWCYHCEHVAPLGKLQSLKRLHISGFDAVKCLGSEMYGDGEIAFPSLESLSLYSMNTLEELATVSRIDIFPCLLELIITSCPMLVKLPIIPSVRTLDIEESNALLLRSVTNFSSLSFLRICSFPEVTLLPEGFMQNHAHLVHIEIYDMRSLKSLSDQFNDLPALKYLSLERCDKLDILPECLWNLDSLESLYIYGCMELNCLHATGLNGLSSLRKLTIVNCPKFAFLSEGLQCFTGLENLFIVGCPELSSLPESIQHLTSLRYLRISDCSGLTSFSNQIGHLTMLSHLAIFECPNLMSLPEEVQSLKNLRELMIGGCPNLQRLCEKETGCDWPKIAHIPKIHINGQLIQCLNC